MVAELRRSGWLRSPAWITAFNTVPREAFVPRFFVTTERGTWRAVDQSDPDWLSTVYSVNSLVTQLDGDNERWLAARREPVEGEPTSSSSDPGLMASMLEALDVQDNHRVLEIGTGAGYNAALLCHRLGSAKVTSIDIDPGLVAAARARLGRLGYTPTVVVGDGTDGISGTAPFDRIIATVAVPTVPLPWLAQTRPGGLILLNPYSRLGSAALLLLRVDGPRRAEGHFLSSAGAFMPLRSPTPVVSAQQRLGGALHGPDGIVTSTDIPADVLRHPDAGMLIGLLVKNAGWIGFTPTESASQQLWLLATDGSWAMREADTVEQAGPRRLWDEVAAAYLLWRSLGEPSRDRFGVTVDGDRCRLWLDEPGRPVVCPDRDCSMTGGTSPPRG